MKSTSGRSRWALALFFFACATTLGELGWWTLFNLRNTARQKHERMQHLASQVHLAQGLWLSGTEDGIAMGMGELQARERARQRLMPHFAALSFEHDSVVAARVDVAQELQREFAAHVRMFLAEGLVFAVLLASGAALIFRTMRHELGVVRQASNFLAAITHELKSPLSSLRLWVETLQRRPPDAAALTRSLAIMHADIDRLQTLIGNVLTAAQLEAPQAQRRQGSAALLAPRIELLPLCAAIVAQMQPQAHSHGVQLRLQPPLPGTADTPLCIRMEQASFELVLRNLLDNAIKYRGEGPFVDVALQAVGARVRLLVTDYGIGLAAGEHERIFEKFYRVGDEMVRASAGTGLGLFLVASVVQAHGGSVRAISDGLGCGTCFEVVFAPAANDGEDKR